MSTPLFDRLDQMLMQQSITESEAEMLKLAVVELARDDVDPETDAVGTDGRDLVLHARDACDAAGIELDDDEDGDGSEDNGEDES